MLVNVAAPAGVFRVARVAASILANAESTGAKIVYCAPSKVFAKLTAGFRDPETAAVSVFRSGLFDAATVTGEVDIPVTEPGPVGTSLAYAAHPVPTSIAAESLLGLAIALCVGAGALVVVLAHADSPRAAAAAREMMVSVLPVLDNMEIPFVMVRGLCCMR